MTRHKDDGCAECHRRRCNGTDAVVGILLEMFSVVDDVFTEERAMAPENIHKGMGRIYRSWKEARKELDGAGS